MLRFFESDDTVHELNADPLLSEEKTPCVLVNNDLTLTTVVTHLLEGIISGDKARKLLPSRTIVKIWDVALTINQFKLHMELLVVVVVVF